MAFPHEQLLQQQCKSFRNLLTPDGQISPPIDLISASSFAAQSHPQLNVPFNLVRLAPGPIPGLEGTSVDLQWNPCEPKNKRLKDQEFVENSQISSVDLSQTRSVSTGLGLSLDDRRLAASSGDPIGLSFFDEEINRVLQRQDAEIDRFVKVQGERLRQAIIKKVQDNQLNALSCVEERFLQKLRQKEAEVEDINKRNTELEERMKQLSIEAGTWQHRAKCNENMIIALKYNLQNIVVQSKDSKEGCGDSEVDDTASCYNGGAIDFHLLSNMENKDLKDSMTCRICRVNEVCMLLLPCRHLCLCKACESKFSACPLCQSSKFIGMEVYM